jgi:hypothetical protein
LEVETCTLKSIQCLKPALMSARFVCAFGDFGVHDNAYTMCSRKVRPALKVLFPIWEISCSDLRGYDVLFLRLRLIGRGANHAGWGSPKLHCPQRTAHSGSGEHRDSSATGGTLSVNSGLANPEDCGPLSMNPTYPDAGEDTVQQATHGSGVGGGDSEWLVGEDPPGMHLVDLVSDHSTQSLRDRLSTCDVCAPEFCLFAFVFGHSDLLVV